MRFGKTVATVVVASGLVAACNLAVDSRLDVRTANQFVKPGDDITGHVINPDGKIVVALQNFVTHELTTCIYKSGKRTFTCPTSTDAEGLYVVGVTDSSQPDSGTQKAPVAVTAIDDYAPQVSVQEKAAVGEDVAVSLLMWGAGRTVTVKVIDKDKTTVFTGKTKTGQDGGGKVVVSGLKQGDYSLEVADRLWTIGGTDSDRRLELAVSN